MSDQLIEESGMTFGPYPSDLCFYIEKSETYRRIRKKIKIAEFLLLRKKPEKTAIWVIEAKSSSPKEENRQNFDAFIAEIREKFVNAFSLGWSCCLGRHLIAEGELPEDFKDLDLARSDVRFILVINGHRDSWLPPLQDALNIAMNSTVRTWAFAPASVAVINDKMARQHGLICPE